MSIKKHDACIHCGKPPYPVCPECNGFWNTGSYGYTRGCLLCGYKPTEEEQAIITSTCEKYKEIKDRNKSLQQDAEERYSKLHDKFIKFVRTEDMGQLLALTKALEIARRELEK